jgi:hypothetical protein
MNPICSYCKKDIKYTYQSIEVNKKVYHKECYEEIKLKNKNKLQDFFERNDL